MISYELADGSRVEISETSAELVHTGTGQRIERTLEQLQAHLASVASFAAEAIDAVAVDLSADTEVAISFGVVLSGDLNFGIVRTEGSADLNVSIRTSGRAVAQPASQEK